MISVFEVVAAGLGWYFRENPGTSVKTAQIRRIRMSLGNNKTFREYSKSGKSASSRMPKLVPLGRDLFRGV